MTAMFDSCRKVLCQSGVACLSVVAVWLLLSEGRAVETDNDKNVEQIKGDDRIAVLRFLAAHNEANYRKIQTWRGKYHFVERFPYKMSLPAKDAKSPPLTRDVLMIREGTAEFVLDMAADKLWSDCQEDPSKTRFLSLDGKEEFKPSHPFPFKKKEILTADRWTQLSDVPYGPLPEHPEDPHRVRQTSSRLARRDVLQPNERFRDPTDRLDPRRFYSTGTVLVWESLGHYSIRALTGEDGEEVRAWVSRTLEISKSGPPGVREYKITKRLRESGRPVDEKETAMTITRFAEKDQYLPIEHKFLSKEGMLHQYRSWIYQRINDILIPKEFHITFNETSNGKLISDRHLRFIDGVLNEPLPDEDAFSIDRLGLTKGERLEDKVENRLYVSDGNKLVPASEYSATARSKHSNKSWLLAIGSGFLLITLAIFWVRRRLRSPKSREGT